MNKDIVCGVDIGASSVRALIAEASVSNMRNENILGFSETPAKGFGKGIVTNAALLSDAIEEVVSEAESKARVKIRRVISNISGVHIKTFKSRGSIHISDRPSEITRQDISRCIESARLIAMSFDREVLELTPERFFIDDRLEIEDPLGLFGSKLDVDLNITTSLVTVLQSLTKSINLAGYEASDIVISAQASALGAIEESRLKEGAILIDIGKDITEVGFFEQAKLKESFYFPFGGDDLTIVLQDNLKILFEEADDLRLKYGIVSKSGQGIYDTGEVVIPSMRKRDDVNKDTSLPSAKFIPRRELSNILLPKIEEMMQEVSKKISPYMKKKKSTPYVCIAGGISRMDGFIEAVEDIFGFPVEMGRAHNASSITDPAFITCLGLVRLGAVKLSDKKQPISNSIDTDNKFGGLIAKAKQIWSEYF